MPTCDQAHTSTSSAWTAERVKDRLVEAFKVWRRLPADRRPALASSWPAQPVHDFVDVLHWDDARKRVWENWERARGAYSFEISRMEEAEDWLLWLDDGERNCLKAWAMVKSGGRSLTAALRKRKWSRTTFYRRVDQGAARIARRLNDQGVKVR